MLDSNASAAPLDSEQLGDILASFQMEWELPIALMLVSLVWWENFIDRDIKCGSLKLVNTKLLKDNITATRCKTNLISSVWKTAATILFAYLFFPNMFHTQQVFTTPDEPLDTRFPYPNGWGLSPNNFFNQPPAQQFAANNDIPNNNIIPVIKRSVRDR